MNANVCSHQIEPFPLSFNNSDRDNYDECLKWNALKSSLNFENGQLSTKCTHLKFIAILCFSNTNIAKIHIAHPRYRVFLRHQCYIGRQAHRFIQLMKL
jgi:hypothetical protein